MTSTPSPQMSLYQRNLLFLVSPGLWPHWPYLPLVRRRKGKEEELGVLFDAFGANGASGYSSTVFLSLLFEMPADFDQVLQLPKEAFDTPEELYAAGWRVD